MSALVARWLALPPNLRGILWVALSGVLFALLNVFTLIPAQHLNSYVMAFLRYFFGALFLVPIVMRLGLYRSLHTRRLPLHISRGAIHTAGMMLWFVALPLTTLAEITALGFTGPIFVTIGAALFLAEKVRLRRWMAVIVACALPFALWFWQTPQWGDIVWFLLAGLAGTLGHICQQRGYQLADITLLQPIGFLSLIWNTMLGYFLFFQKPDVWTFVGAAVIFASALYISHREAVRRAQIRTAASQATPEA